MKRADHEIEKIDKLVRAGRITEAQDALQRACSKRLVRADLARWANLLRRTHQPELVVRLLHRVVRRTSSSRRHPPSQNELAEYGAALGDLGRRLESLEVLSRVDSSKGPVALLYRSYACFAGWDWSAGARHLREFVTRRDAPEDLRLWGLVFLGGALAQGEGDDEQASAFLEEALAASRPGRDQLLRANALLTSLQCAVLSGNRSSVTRAWNRLAHDGGGSPLRTDPLIALIARQWMAISRLHSDRERGLRELARVRESFTTRRRWENVRSCDLYRAIFLRDRRLLLHLYFGTRYPALKERIRRELGSGELPERYTWELRSQAGRGVLKLDSRNGESSAGGTSLKPNQVLQRLLGALTADFYRAQGIPELHEAVFPNRHFAPLSAPNGIHQAIHRFRTWIRENRLPLAVTEESGGFRLTAVSGKALIEVPSFPPPTHWRKPLGKKALKLLETLRKEFGKQHFSAPGAARASRGSYRTVVRTLGEAVDRELLERIGRGPTTRYRFTE